MTDVTPPDRRRTAARCVGAALAASAALAALATPALAAGGSIVFVREANVWLANPDGSGQYQVTTDGTAANPYQTPSQADDGTIVAVRQSPNLGPIIRMKQNGTVINEIPVFSMQAGPLDPAISPDGRFVAYAHAYTNTHETSHDTRITDVSGLTHPNVYGHPGPGYGSPSWLADGRVLVASYVTVSTMIPGQPAVEWWSDWDNGDVLGGADDLDDGEAAPDGTVAFVRGDRDGNGIVLYRADGAGRMRPTCGFSNPSPGPLGQRFADPTFSPSGDAIAWQEGDGIWITELPGSCEATRPRLLLAGASAPDWGPAPVNPGPRETPPPAPPVRPTPPVPTPPTGPVTRAPTTRRAPLSRRGGATRRTAARACARGSRRARAACQKRVKKAAALRACARKSGVKRTRCVAAVKRRFR